MFSDCDYGTLLASPEEMTERITPRTRAVIPVHFAGAPADLDPIQEAAGRAGVPVIEDAAHAVGTAYRGNRITSYNVCYTKLLRSSGPATWTNTE